MSIMRTFKTVMFLVLGLNVWGFFLTQNPGFAIGTMASAIALMWSSFGDRS